MIGAHMYLHRQVVARFQGGYDTPYTGLQPLIRKDGHHSCDLYKKQDSLDFQLLSVLIWRFCKIDQETQDD